MTKGFKKSFPLSQHFLGIGDQNDGIRGVARFIPYTGLDGRELETGPDLVRLALVVEKPGHTSHRKGLKVPVNGSW